MVFTSSSERPARRTRHVQRKSAADHGRICYGFYTSADRAGPEEQEDLDLDRCGCARGGRRRPSLMLIDGSLGGVVLSCAWPVRCGLGCAHVRTYGYGSGVDIPAGLSGSRSSSSRRPSAYGWHGSTGHVRPIRRKLSISKY